MDATIRITKALADETRLRILMCLEDSTLCLCHLTEILGLAPSTVSKHLQILSNAGLVTSHQSGRWRHYRRVEPRLVEEPASSTAARALEFVSAALAESTVVAKDVARRSLALESCAAPGPSDEKPSVLFLCTGNACRSQMAEGFLRLHAGDRFEALSAGLKPRKIPALTHTVMKERGISMDGHRPKSVMEFLGKTQIGYLVVVCPDAEDRVPVFPGVAHRLFWPIEPPSSSRDRKGRVARFRAARDLIERRINAWLDELPTLEEPTSN